jgi:hypothetical protein
MRGIGRGQSHGVVLEADEASDGGAALVRYFSGYKQGWEMCSLEIP